MKVSKPVLIFVSSCLICGCSNMQTLNSESTTIDENQSLLITESWDIFSPKDLSVKEQKTYSRITNAFYEQVFKQKGVLDDSSFCDNYEPRKITIDSIKPFYDFGTYNNAYILTFIINGFFNNTSRYIVSFNTDYSSIAISTENETSGYLMPYVYKNGSITTISEAYTKGILKKDYFDFASNGAFYSMKAKGSSSILSQIGRNYFDNLPSFVNGGIFNYSPLNTEFEEVKQRFYKQEIINRNYQDDRAFRELYVESRYRRYYIDITLSSIHLNYYKELSDDTRLFLISINDILFDKITGWNNTPRSHLEFNIGEKSCFSLYVIDPIVDIRGNIYYLDDAIKGGFLSESATETLKEVISNNRVLDEHPLGFISLETKRLERHCTLNKIHEWLKD